MRLVPVIGSAIGMLGAGLIAVDYSFWSVKPGPLAEDDFRDQCTSLDGAEIGIGRFEGVVWSTRNEAGECDDVLGSCIVNKVDGSFRNSTLEEHQVTKRASDPANCTYFGHLLTGRPQFRKIN